METLVSNLGAKLLQVQKEIGVITKSSDNPHFRSKYASLDDVLAVVKPVLTANGLVLNQPCGKDAFGQFVETRIFEPQGQAVNSVFYFSGNEDTMQKLGAAATYGRRFALVSLLALEQEDDDGNTASGNPKPASTTKATAPANKPVITSRDGVNKAIRQTAKVAADMKKQTMDDTGKWIETTYGVKQVEGLTDEQATEVLKTLQGKVKS